MTTTDEIARLSEENRRLKEERDTWRAQYHRDMADVIRERDAAVKRAEQAEREIMLARESDGCEIDGRLVGRLIFSEEFRQETEGKAISVRSADRDYQGVARFRGSELWLTEIEPELPRAMNHMIVAAPIAPPTTMPPVVLQRLGVHCEELMEFIAPPETRHHGKRAQRRRARPWCRP
jgi:hypothetical protein